MQPGTYARYSSSNQREASIEDQLRDTFGLSSSLGLPEPAVYSDSEISGERRDRPGYVRLLRDAQAGVFKVLLLWDLKRLSRAEDLPQVLARFRFWGVRVITCDGYDSAREDADIRGWIDGLMGNRYLRDLAKATHRGLTGRALAGASAGGLPYGYRVTETGQRAIVAEQAAVVRRIFDEFIAGASPRAIAAGLNRDRVPSSRGSTWAMTAIRADTRRGIGILGNPIYVGDQVWNRSRWVKHPETGRRVRQERPESEWIVRARPELAIVDRATWDAAQSLVRGREQGRRPRIGRPPRHLLSGILRCGQCGGPLVAVDATCYGCSRAKERGTCTSRLRVDRRSAESALLAGVRAELLGEEAFQRFQREAAAAMRRNAPDRDRLQRELSAAEARLENILAAIREGIRTASTKAELVRAEAAVDAARAELDRAKQLQPAKIVPRARAVWDRIVGDLTDLARGKDAARAALRTLVGEQIVVRLNENGDPIAEVAASTVQINVVAGAGFEPATFGL